MANKKKFEPTEKEIKDWNEVEDLVLKYQTCITSDDPEEKEQSKVASEELLNRFAPLFKKYMMLIKHNQIDFNDMEQKSFVEIALYETTHVVWIFAPIFLISAFFSYKGLKTLYSQHIQLSIVSFNLYSKSLSKYVLILCLPTYN